MELKEFIGSDLHKELKKAGFISYKLDFYADIKDKHDQLIKAGVPKAKVVGKIAALLGLPHSTIYNARRRAIQCGL